MAFDAVEGLGFRLKDGQNQFSDFLLLFECGLVGASPNVGGRGGTGGLVDAGLDSSGAAEFPHDSGQIFDEVRVDGVFGSVVLVKALDEFRKFAVWVLAGEDGVAGEQTVTIRNSLIR